MTVAGYVVWFIGMAIAVLAILTIGTLAAADIIRLPHPRRSRHQGPPGRHPARPGTPTTPAGLQEPGAKARPAAPVHDRDGKERVWSSTASSPSRRGNEIGRISAARRRGEDHTKAHDAALTTRVPRGWRKP